MSISVIYDVILKKLRMRDPLPEGWIATEKKLLIGTVSGADGGIELMPHGIDDIARIISVNVNVNVGTLIPPSYTALSDYEYHWFINDTNISIQNIMGKSSRLYDKPVTAYITYTE